MNFYWITRAVFGLFLHPSLWLTACRQVLRLASSGWWRRPPFLPLPAPAYTRFRVLTQYGEPDYSPDVGDLVTWFIWVRDMEKG